MKRFSFIIFGLLMALSGGTWGQTKIWEFGEHSSDTAIVRCWRGEEYFVYSRTGSGGGVLSYHDNFSGTVISTPVPDYLIFNDFRIANDTIFAGGTLDNSGSRHGLLACIDINSMLSGSCNINFCTFPYSNLTYSNCSTEFYNHPAEIRRIALFKYGNATRIAYISDNHITSLINPNEVYYHRVGYGDAVFLSSGQWTFGPSNYNKDGYEDFTDICCTENKIVLVARNNQYSTLKFQVFDKVWEFAIEPPSSQSTFYGFDDHKVLSHVAVTHIAGDEVAMAYQYDDGVSTGLALKTLDVGGSTPLLQGYYNIFDSTLSVGGGPMGEMRYNGSTGKLMILSSMSYKDNVERGYVVNVDMATIASCVYQIEHGPYIETYRLQSIDCFPDGFIAAGGNGPVLTTFNDKQDPATTCAVRDEIGAARKLPSMVNITRPHCVAKYDDAINALSSSNAEEAIIF